MSRRMGPLSTACTVSYCRAREEPSTRIWERHRTQEHFRTLSLGLVAFVVACALMKNNKNKKKLALDNFNSFKNRCIDPATTVGKIIATRTHKLLL